MKYEPNYDHVLQEREFSKFVADIYGRPFRLQQLWGLHQDSYTEFVVTESSDADRADAAAAIAEWQALWPVEGDAFSANLTAIRDHDIDFELLVVDLHARGYLQTGSHLMKVSW